MEPNFQLSYLNVVNSNDTLKIKLNEIQIENEKISDE